MKKSLVLSLLTSAVFAISAPASASVYKANYQWTGTQLNAITFQNDVQIQNVNLGTSYTSSYGLWSGAIDNSFSAAFNFYNNNGSLVFTYAPSGKVGDSSFAIPLLNSVDGPLTALTGGTKLLASNAVQDLLTFSADGGRDTYILQFQDLSGPAAAAPEPSSFALLVLGLAGLVNIRRKVKQA